MFNRFKVFKSLEQVHYAQPSISMAEDSFKEVILSCYDVGMDNIGLARGTARLGTYSIS